MAEENGTPRGPGAGAEGAPDGTVGSGPVEGNSDPGGGGAEVPVSQVTEEVRGDLGEPDFSDYPEDEDDVPAGGAGPGSGLEERVWSGDPEDLVEDDDEDYILDLRGEDSMTLVRALNSVMGADGLCRNLQITVSQVRSLLRGDVRFTPELRNWLEVNVQGLVDRNLLTSGLAVHRSGPQVGNGGGGGSGQAAMSTTVLGGGALAPATAVGPSCPRSGVGN